MATRLWGKKIGMTQVFSNNKVIPVTAIDIGNWLVTNIKTKERDGYDAVQVGLLKNRHVDTPFETEWFTDSNKFFYYLKKSHLMVILRVYKSDNPLILMNS